MGITWTSAGVTRTATTSVSGQLSGDAAGEINCVVGLIFIRPNYMIDAGGEFSITYTWSSQLEETFAVTPDGTGSVTVTLAQEPTPGSISCEWLVTRTTKASSGATVNAESTAKSTDSGTKNYDPAEVTSTYTTTPPLTTGGGANGPGQGSVYDPKPVVPFVPKTTTSTHFYPRTGTFEKSASDSSTHATVSSQTSEKSVTTMHAVTDDGVGHLFGTFGIVGYVAKSITVKAVSSFEETTYETTTEQSSAWESLNNTGDASTVSGMYTLPGAAEGGGGSTTAKGGDYGSESFTEAMSGNLLVRYKTGIATPASVTETYTPDMLVLDLCPRTKDYIVPGSVKFTWMGTAYTDFEGTLYYGRTSNNPGTPCGVMNYSAGTALLSDYVVSGTAAALTLNSLWTSKPIPRASSTVFNVAVAPIKSGGLVFTRQTPHSSPAPSSSAI